MTRDEAERHLRSLAGPDARLREDQWTAISALVDGRRALVVQRTGWGKSAVYFVATALLRAGGRIKPPDAIQLATAGTAGCDLFLTNDERLMGTTVQGIQFITSFDRAPI